MTTAPVSLIRPHARPSGSAPARGATAIGAALASIAGWMAAIAIGAVALLVVPVAAIIVFGPALLELI